MSLYLSEYLDSRIEEVAENLKITNSEYALALQKAEELMENMEPIIQSERGITVSAEDCLDFQEFFEHEYNSAVTIKKELYKQGYLDCVHLFKMLGILV